jgi:hypothetical protein
MTPTLNAKGKKFYWSYSALSSYEQCPAKYAGTSFYCNVPWKSSAESDWGNRVHKAGELTLKGIPQQDTEAFKPVEPYVNNMLTCGHPVEAELEITLTSDFTETSWFAKDAWLRCKIDVLISKGTTASQFDWKTGKSIRENPDQLHLCDAALSTIRPQYERFEGRYIWTQHKTVTPVRPLSKEDIPGVWADFLPRVARMQQAWDRDHFPPRPSGLCPWCQVKNCKQRQGEMRR